MKRSYVLYSKTETAMDPGKMFCTFNPVESGETALNFKLTPAEAEGFVVGKSYDMTLTETPDPVEG